MNRKLALLLVAFLGCSVATTTPEPQFFSFHSNVWLNLHHFLRLVARGAPVTAALSEEERAAWDRAVALYRTRYAQRDLLHDEVMSGIRVALRDAEGKASLEGVSIDAELRATLEAVAPIYRRHWWSAHDRDNQAWIAAIQPLLREHGRAIADRVARTYGEVWPEQPVPIDLTMTAGPNGAYAAFPAHVTIDATDRGHHGLAGLESVFHESSHQWGRRLSTAIAKAEERHGKEVPRGLWHAVLFYNAGEITRDVLSKHGVAGYMENGIKGNVYADFCGPNCRELIARHWQPVLDGTGTFATALDEIVAEWPKQ